LFCISIYLLYISIVVSPGFDFVGLVLAEKLAGKSISEITFFVSSGSAGHQKFSLVQNQPSIPTIRP